MSRSRNELSVTALKTLGDGSAKKVSYLLAGALTAARLRTQRYFIS